MKIENIKEDFLRVSLPHTQSSKKVKNSELLYEAKYKTLIEE